MKSRCELFTHAKRTLRSRPDRQFVAAPLGHGRPWLQWGVLDVGHRVGLCQGLAGRSRGERFTDRSRLMARPSAESFSGRRMFAEVLEQPGLRWLLGSGLP